MTYAPIKYLRARILCDPSYIFDDHKLVLDVDWYTEGDVLALTSVFLDESLPEDAHQDTFLMITSSPQEEGNTFKYCIDILDKDKAIQYFHLYRQGDTMFKVFSTPIKNKEKMEYFSFGEAIEAMKEGQKVSRGGFKKTRYIYMDKSADNGHGDFVGVRKDGTVKERWSPCNRCMLATDWYTVYACMSSDTTDAEYVTTYPRMDIITEGNTVGISTHVRLYRDGEYHLCFYDRRLYSGADGSLHQILNTVAEEIEGIRQFGKLPMVGNTHFCVDLNQEPERDRVAKISVNLYD